VRLRFRTARCTQARRGDLARWALRRRPRVERRRRGAAGPRRGAGARTFLAKGSPAVCSSPMKVSRQPPAGRALVGAARARGVRFERVAHSRYVRMRVACEGCAHRKDLRRVNRRQRRPERGRPTRGRAGTRARCRAPVPARCSRSLPVGAIHALVWLGHRYLVPRDDARLLVGGQSSNAASMRASPLPACTTCSMPLGGRARSGVLCDRRDLAGLRPHARRTTYIGSTRSKGTSSRVALS